MEGESFTTTCTTPLVVGAPAGLNASSCPLPSGSGHSAPDTRVYLLGMPGPMN